MARPSRYSPEVRERAVRRVLEHQDEHDGLMVWFGPSALARGLVLSLFLVALLAASPAPPVSRTSPVAQDEETEQEESTPANIGLEEEVEVRITQIELSAWPKDDDVQACMDLDVSDFELLVNGMPREIIAIDRLHEYARCQRPCFNSIEDLEVEISSKPALAQRHDCILIVSPFLTGFFKPGIQGCDQFVVSK